MNSKVRTFASALALALLVSSCGKDVPLPASQPSTPAAKAPAQDKPASAPAEEDDVYVDRDTLVMYSISPKGSIPETPATPERVALGKLLFGEKGIAKGGDASCATCHDPARHFADPGKARSVGAGGVETKRNTPSLIDVARNAVFFWDYRATTIEDAIAMHAKEPSTYGVPDDAALTARLAALTSAKDAFAKAFPGEKDPASAANFAKAVGAYVRTLTAPTRFDAFLDGDDDALTAKQKRGLKLFTSTLNCMSCHNSRLVGGTLMNKFGIAKPYESADLGRFEVTKRDDDKHMYKVPSLVNVARTAPYFHDGSAKTLDEAIAKMSVHQFGRDVKPDELADLAAFLAALDSK